MLGNSHNFEIQIDEQSQVSSAQSRMRFFTYSEMQPLRHNLVRRRLRAIILDVFIIILLVALNLRVQFQVLSTTFSLNERDWICKFLDEIALIFGGITVFKIATITVSPR